MISHPPPTHAVPGGGGGDFKEFGKVFIRGDGKRGKLKELGESKGKGWERVGEEKKIFGKE